MKTPGGTSVLGVIVVAIAIEIGIVIFIVIVIVIVIVLDNGLLSTTELGNNSSSGHNTINHDCNVIRLLITVVL